MSADDENNMEQHGLEMSVTDVNDASGNDASGNDASGNDASGNDASGNEFYRDLDQQERGVINQKIFKMWGPLVTKHGEPQAHRMF